ncbi:cation:proton antiporter domain-containing protein [Desulfolithobacter sp.]
MINVTLGIAILLAVGLLSAKFFQLLRLPSVTGFILAGLALGPSSLGLITADTIGHNLSHFTEIALMLIAFGIGEHVELRTLRGVAGDVGWISVIQAIAAYVLVAVGTFLTVWMVTPLQDGGISETLILSLLLGAVAVATAPAAILHVVRESGARGPLTSTLMAVVAVDDGLAIMIFGITMSVCRQLASPGDVSVYYGLLFSFYEIGASLLIGVITGFLIDYCLHKLHNRGEMLTGGLALLLLCGELCRMLHLSPLLAGMAAGFTIINRAERDERLFRALNAFEPPIYVLFFTMAGAHLDLGALKMAGWIGTAYFVFRALGKYFGTLLGGYISGAPPVVRNYLGLSLLPQAGVAIGLVFMISSDPQLGSWTTIITPVVLANVVLSELFGPLLVRMNLVKGGEVAAIAGEPDCEGRRGLACRLWLRRPESVRLPPWTLEKLHPASRPKGVVVFGAYHHATVRGLARVATMLAHHYNALPMSVRVLDKGERGRNSADELEAMFLPEKDEAASLGYPLRTEVIYDSPASGIVAAAEYNNARAVVLGHARGHKSYACRKVVDKVAANVLCPVVTVHFVGTLACERILVPFLFFDELDELLPVVEAVATVGHSRITFLQLLHLDSSREEQEACERRLGQWLDEHFFDVQTRFRVEAAESRLESILQESRYHDFIVMTASRKGGINRLFFGSLADSVARNSRRSVFVVHPPRKLPVEAAAELESA